ncbi:MAG: hypothetical protein WDO68_30600 [Gammaproteobacteria bacterium]
MRRLRDPRAGTRRPRRHASAGARSRDRGVSSRHRAPVHEHIHASLSDLIAGTRHGRTRREQITVFKSVGAAWEDAAATALLLRSADRLDSSSPRTQSHGSGCLPIVLIRKIGKSLV